jgi:AraC family transcriptional regulator
MHDADSDLEPLTDRRIDLAPLHAKPFDDPLLTAVMKELWREAERADEISRLFVDSATALLAARLWRLRGAQEPTRRKPAGLSPWARKRAIDYLQSRLGEPVMPMEVAAAVRLSPSHFCTAFRQSFGMPPHRWLMARRIERAKALLAAPGPLVSISEVALACGFATSAHFAAAFRRRVGVSPSQWRALHES